MLAFFGEPPVEAATVAPEAATPTPATAKATETAPTAATETTVAPTAFCAGGTHTLVVMFESSCEGGDDGNEEGESDAVGDGEPDVFGEPVRVG